jgi:lipoprotein-anchoring transpeptidase ErfK/SrfK
MTQVAPTLPGIRRGASAHALALIAVVSGCVAVVPAQAATPQPATARPLVALLHDHVARTRPAVHARRIESVAALRPLTRVRTILPVLGETKRGRWLRVRLPGRPNAHTGWIRRWQTRSTSTEWRLALRLSTRRVTVYRHGRALRSFRAVIGNPWTPTPHGRFFVEEAVALPDHVGGPFALATSARSNVLQEFAGGPGQIALHGTNGLAGALGTAASHGCIRLSTSAITWLARRIGSGVPLIIRR